jgi:hypothetical protein
VTPTITCRPVRNRRGRSGSHRRERFSVPAVHRDAGSRGRVRASRKR